MKKSDKLGPPSVMDVDFTPVFGMLRAKVRPSALEALQHRLPILGQVSDHLKPEFLEPSVPEVFMIDQSKVAYQLEEFKMVKTGNQTHYYGKVRPLDTDFARAAFNELSKGDAEFKLRAICDLGAHGVYITNIITFDICKKEKV